MPKRLWVCHPCGVGSPFPTTRWSVVLGAAQMSGPPARAIGELCEAYWRPLYAYLRRTGMSPEDAEDTVQGFLSTLLSGKSFARVDRERGKFRSYLLGALRHYISDQRTRARAQKRGGGVVPIALTIDRDDAEATLDIPDDRTPEGAYAHAWGLQVLDRARARLRSRYADGGRLAVFEALEPFLLGADAPRYRVVASQLGMTEANARVAVHRLRARFGAALREEVADTLDSATDADIDAELRAVIDATRSD